MDGNDILRLGYRPGKVIGLALHAADAARADGATDDDILSDLADVLNAPADYLDDPVYGPVAEALAAYEAHRERSASYNLDSAAPYRVWGADGIESGALDQMKRAVRLPVAIRGALMPDAHQGYGLPIGGVLATDNSVIPYAVGVDIACRMRMTVFNASPHILDQRREMFRQVLEEQTRFGMGSAWYPVREHEVLDDPLWQDHPVARRYVDVAAKQLGSSGSGNHFVEFGALTVHTSIESPLGTIPPGTYLAALSHSGSRRFGLEMAEHYTKVAMQLRATLPKDFKHLAWLRLDEEAGQEYWAAMTLAGKYASANHAVIHRQLIDVLRIPVLGGIENHHNFAWRETVDGQDAIVHRKGATPAGAGRARRDPRQHERAGLRGARPGQYGRDQQRGARRGPPHEPQAGVQPVQLGFGERQAEIVRRGADLRRVGRSARRVQGHPASDGRSGRSRDRVGRVPAEAGQDGCRRETALSWTGRRQESGSQARKTR